MLSTEEFNELVLSYQQSGFRSMFCPDTRIIRVLTAFCTPPLPCLLLSRPPLHRLDALQLYVGSELNWRDIELDGLKEARVLQPSLLVTVGCDPVVPANLHMKGTYLSGS